MREARACRTRQKTETTLCTWKGSRPKGHWVWEEEGGTRGRRGKRLRGAPPVALDPTADDEGERSGERAKGGLVP